jgi:cytidylate kinase
MRGEGAAENTNGTPKDAVAYRDVITIDGPAAAGKTTVARAVADRLQAMLFDTGVLYRALTVAALRAGIDVDDGRQLTALAERVRISVIPPSKNDGRLYDVHLDGDDVTWAIREKAVDASVSQASAHAEVRQALLPLQRRIAAGGRVVMVGRDIGTVVVPEAGLKIYLDAGPEERARRRCQELRDRGQPADYASILQAMRDRDAIDSGRSVAPLRAAADAIIVDTDGRSIAEVADQVVALAAARGHRCPTSPSDATPAR